MTLNKILKTFMLTGLVAILTNLSSCASDESDNSNDGGNQIPNPSAVYCKGNGYDYQIRTDKDGNQYGVCVFPDDSECDGWDFFEGKCGQQYSFCEKNGGKITTSTNNCHYDTECAVCTLPEGTECDEWEYFNDRCP